MSATETIAVSQLRTMRGDLRFPHAHGPSHRWHLWILDVDGLRFVVQSTDYAGTSRKHRSELQATVDSITIEP